MFRICHGSSNTDVSNWEPIIDSARQHNYVKKDSNGNPKTNQDGSPIFSRELKGFGIARARFFIEKGFGVEPKASVENPLHMHLIIPNYNIPMRETSSFSELIPQDQRTLLEDLRHEVKKILVDNNNLTIPPHSTICDLCRELP